VGKGIADSGIFTASGRILPGITPYLIGKRNKIIHWIGFEIFGIENGLRRNSNPPCKNDAGNENLFHVCLVIDKRKYDFVL